MGDYELNKLYQKFCLRYVYSGLQSWLIWKSLLELEDSLKLKLISFLYLPKIMSTPAVHRWSKMCLFWFCFVCALQGEGTPFPTTACGKLWICQFSYPHNINVCLYGQLPHYCNFWFSYWHIPWGYRYASYLKMCMSNYWYWKNSFYISNSRLFHMRVTEVLRKACIKCMVGASYTFSFVLFLL